MRIVRSIVLAMAATLGASGCAAWNTRPISPSPRPSLTEQTLDVDEFVASHNRNADQIKSLEARPSIGVKSPGFSGGVDGRLALERPRNFKLELLGPMHTVKANIGSNDQEFWFWVNSNERKIYWCNYDELDSAALAVTYQPDWIIESLGLKPITPEEARGLKSREGELRGTTALVFPARKNGGETYTRMMIVWNQSRRIKEHRLYEGTVPSPRALLAQAEVGRYTEFTTDSSQDADSQKCYLPQSIKLDWKRDQLALDVVMEHDKVKVNQFDSSRSAQLFVEPVTGHARVNLAELSRSQRREPITRTRQTLPPPAARGTPKPGPTTTEPNDATTMAPRARAGRRPGGSATTPLEDLVTAPLPVAPDATVSARTDLYQIGR